MTENMSDWSSEGRGEGFGLLVFIESAMSFLITIQTKEEGALAGNRRL